MVVVCIAICKPRVSKAWVRVSGLVFLCQRGSHTLSRRFVVKGAVFVPFEVTAVFVVVIDEADFAEPTYGLNVGGAVDVTCCG